jgi:uncharacterized repeat protein (TIGR04138 family)
MPEEEPTPRKSMEEVIHEDGRYPQEAFAFLHDGLGHAVRLTHGEDAESLEREQEEPSEDPASPGRHVTGAQLCWGLRDLAIRRWGSLARCVLHRWNIRETLDFGHMVYLLIEHGYMRKTPEDSEEDFRDVYDFQEAFEFEETFSIQD